MSIETWSGDLTTRAGLTFHVRPAGVDDEAALGAFFRQVSPEDLRFRFLGGIREVGHDRLKAMTDVDHAGTENFLAFVGDEIIGTAMLACDPSLERGEVAISVRAQDKHKGVAWELLRHASRYAEAKGVKVLESLESRQNHEALEVEREFGFSAGRYEDDPTLMVVRKQLRGA